MLFSESYRSKDQKHYKNWILETVFVYILGFIALWRFAQKLIYVIINNFEQDHQLNWIILGVCMK